MWDGSRDEEGWMVRARESHDQERRWGGAECGRVKLRRSGEILG